jgi:ADP-ribose pyrophosphatase YjhB (NUDIX family)
MVVLDKDGLSEQKFLAQYDAGVYKQPSVTADIVLFAAPGGVLRGEADGESHGELDSRHKLPAQDLELLLIRRGGHPYLGKWALPGGFLSPGETLDQAARRELKEETGVDDAADDVYLEQLRTFSNPGRDPRGWTVTGAYLALADRNKLTLKAGDDATDAAWFKVSLTRDDQQLWHLELTGAREVLCATLTETAAVNQEVLPPAALISDLAFDHADIITYALQKLQRDY